MTLPIALAFATGTVLLLGFWLWKKHIYPAPFGIPNGITLSRNVPVSWIIALMFFDAGADENLIIAGLALLVLSLDGLDGYFARKLNQCTDFGARFDMESDAFFILVLCVAAILNCDAPYWVLLIGGMRYFYVMGQQFLEPLRLPVKDRYSRKVFCVIQVVSLILPFTGLLNQSLVTSILFLSLSCLVFSFGRDIRDQYADHRKRLSL